MSKRVSTAVLLCLGLLCNGCQRVADEKAEDGSVATRGEINQALAFAMNGVHARDTRVGSMVLYASVRRIEDSNAGSELGQSMITVTAESNPAPARRVFDLQIDRRVRAEDGDFKATRERSALAVDVVEARAAPTPAPGTVVTYHRLRTATESIAAPAAVRARPNCADLPGCVLPVRYVLFDMITRPPNGPPRKVAMTLGFSTLTPYLPHGDGFDRFDGALVIDCRATTIRSGTRNVTVRDCRTLADFQK